jgi:hypothetical protein
MESDGLKAELQQSSTHPKRWSAPFRASGGGARPSTLLAQVCYIVPDVAIENFLDMESDGLKAELQQSSTHP